MDLLKLNTQNGPKLHFFLTPKKYYGHPYHFYPGVPRLSPPGCKPSSFAVNAVHLNLFSTIIGCNPDQVEFLHCLMCSLSLSLRSWWYHSCEGKVWAFLSSLLVSETIPPELCLRGNNTASYTQAICLSKHI